jgi:CBS domain-containing protein
MFVRDVMQKNVLSVKQNSPVREVIKAIFAKDISGAPVIKNRKLVGIVTEEDIFAHMYPTIQEVIEDYPHARDFKEMEHNIKRLIDIPVSKIMVKRVITVTPDTPLMKAQGVMQSHNFSRLPVVNEKKNLVGIISQGDIFRQIVKQEAPRLAKRKKKK